MPNVTLKQVFPATYVQAPQSAVFPNLPNLIGSDGLLGVLEVRYGSDESRTRWICVFMGEANFHTDPGSISREGTQLTHVYHITPREGILRNPQRDDLTGEFVNEWQLTGPEITDHQERAAFLDNLRARWRVLRRAELGTARRP